MSRLGRSLTNVHVKERWLRMPKTEEGVNDKFRECNLLMRYKNTMNDATLNDLILSSHTSPIGKDDDIIDFRCFLQIGEYAHKVGPNKEKDMNNMLAPVAHAIFSEIFNFTQRTEYIDFKTSRPMISNVRAMADSLHPAYIVFPNDEGGSIAANAPGRNTLHKALDHGYLPAFHSLVLPIDYIYNFDFLENVGMLGEDIGSTLNLYMVLGPGDELHTGRNMGRYRTMQKMASQVKFTTGGRGIQVGGGVKTVHDQQVAVCFYLSKEKESVIKVAEELIEVCKSNTKSRIPDKMFKELAIIKLGSMVYNSADNFRTEFNNTGGESVHFEQFCFDPLTKWKFFPFYYKSTDFNVDDLGGAQLGDVEVKNENMAVQQALRTIYNYSLMNAEQEDYDDDDIPTDGYGHIIADEDAYTTDDNYYYTEGDFTNDTSTTALTQDSLYRCHGARTNYNADHESTSSMEYTASPSTAEEAMSAITDSVVGTEFRPIDELVRVAAKSSGKVDRKKGSKKNAGVGKYSPYTKSKTLAPENA